MDEYLHWQHMNTRVACVSYFKVICFFPVIRVHFIYIPLQAKWLTPVFTQKLPDEKKVAQRFKAMSKTLDDIEVNEVEHY